MGRKQHQSNNIRPKMTNTWTYPKFLEAEGDLSRPTNHIALKLIRLQAQLCVHHFVRVCVKEQQSAYISIIRDESDTAKRKSAN